MEIDVKRVIKMLQKVADYEDDSTADHVLMGLDRVTPHSSAEEIVESIIGSVADGLGVPLV